MALASRFLLPSLLRRPAGVLGPSRPRSRPASAHLPPSRRRTVSTTSPRASAPSGDGGGTAGPPPPPPAPSTGPALDAYTSIPIFLNTIPHSLEIRHHFIDDANTGIVAAVNAGQSRLSAK